MEFVKDEANTDELNYTLHGPVARNRSLNKVGALLDEDLTSNRDQSQAQLTSKGPKQEPVISEVLERLKREIPKLLNKCQYPEWFIINYNNQHKITSRDQFLEQWVKPDGLLYAGMSSIVQTIKDICLSLKSYQLEQIKKSLSELQLYYELAIQKYQKLFQQCGNNVDKGLEIIDSIRTDGLCEIKAPFFGTRVFSRLKLDLLLKQDAQFMQAASSKFRISIQRIGSEYVPNYQRYYLTYVNQKYLFKVNTFPGIVVRIEDYDAFKQDNLDESSSSYYFFIQLLPEPHLKFYPLEEFKVQAAGSGQVELVHSEKPNIKVNPDQFINQLICSAVFTEFENFTPSYIVMEDGTICRHFGMKNSVDQSQYAGMKNPLYFFTEFIKQISVRHEHIDRLLVSFDIFRQLLSAMSFIIESEKSDFKYTIKIETQEPVQVQPGPGKRQYRKLRIRSSNFTKN